MITDEMALDHLKSIIKKARVHLYKPIQIAEILYRDRVYNDINLSDVETYRNSSKKWRDEISRKFLGRICTSSQKFQDDLFNDNAIPPHVLVQLGKINRKSKGSVEAHVYNALKARHGQMSSGLSLVLNSTKETFDVDAFINSFRHEAGLARSIDKVFEIVVYAIFSSILKALHIKIGVKMENSDERVLEDFSEFTEKILGITKEKPHFFEDAKVFRVGVTNAADRGLDMWANFGPAIQIKHMSLTKSLVDEISGNVSADRIIIVCKSCEKEILASVIKQFGGAGKIQSIITEEELVQWYEKALKGKSSNIIGDDVLRILETEIIKEFPTTDESGFEDFWKERNYHLVD